MRGLEILKELQNTALVNHPFVRWWRPENDFCDYDLVERFRSTLGSGEEFGGFELLTMQEMWDELKRITGERVSRYRKSQSGDMIEWRHLEVDGMRVDVLPYSAETMIAIFDAETRDNPVC
ncbi:MAG: hypothetical protein A2091_13390 [Desulfuromonadales bacterium GWD2_61_12]|nr:MAG: hypothetical protein A2005_11995 [Desulfuromonadales bacterium GWC2_61_20]OGR35582.1 MAG: hypothetical protein A2091_13390 [Desulfuromonadales bacterium GWD2_61_12]HAD03328.1 hypothetical protein [Desulfuromonas sp.]HBT82778.1 hypothetical protein [Desulfuromonas sp.]